MQRIYMDHAATTPVRPEVFDVMRPFFTDTFGNPSSIYSYGREAKRALDEARDTIASLLGADSQSEIVFTGGGSEADNLAIKGIAWAARDRGRHIVTSRIEHHAVLDTVAVLERQGFSATYVPVDEYGRVDPKDVAKAVRKDTVLISIMHANNEIGTIQPLEEIGRLARARGIPMHTDAVQTAGVLDVDVNALPIDLLSISAHKIYGPKGVGALYIRRGTPIFPLIHGGGQERERRAGTENVAGIIGLAHALRLACQEREPEARRLVRLRDQLIQGVLDTIEGASLNGDPSQRLPGNASFCFRAVEGEALLLNLDMAGVAASSGSACTSGSIEPSHVLLAMNFPRGLAFSSLRLTLGRNTDSHAVEQVIQLLPPIIERLRQHSNRSLS